MVNGGVDYINVYGISMLVGDVVEMGVVWEIFNGGKMLVVGLIKFFIGYLLGVVGV